MQEGGNKIQEKAGVGEQNATEMVGGTVNTRQEKQKTGN
jgi:hypothetical protein